MAQAREQSIPVRILDPLGPRWLRWALPLVSIGGFWAALDGQGLGSLAPSQLFCLASMALAASRFFPPRFGWRTARLRIRPGGVAIENCGLLSRTVKARSVRALSTASTERGVLVSVACGTGPRPLSIELEHGEDAARVCDALGIGVHGLGNLRWRAGVTQPAERAEVLSALALLVLSALCALRPLGSVSGPAVLLWMALGASLVLLLCTLPYVASVSTIGLGASGVDLRAVSDQWAHVPFGCIEEASIEGDELVLALTAPHKPIRVPIAGGPMGLRALSADEKQQLLAQIESACQRARGLGPERPETPAAVELLARGNTPSRDWLARLDSLARSLTSGGGGYRALPISADELWTTLDDHDAEPELRAAAARVLLRVSPAEARTRVAEVAQTLRDEAATKRLRVVVDDELDLEEAGARLDRLEQRRVG